MPTPLRPVVNLAISALGALVVAGVYLRFGWPGVGFCGIAVLFVATMSELGEHHPATRFTSAAAYRSHYERAVQPLRGDDGHRERGDGVRHRRWLSVARTVGVALCMLGFGMVVLHP